MLLAVSRFDTCLGSMIVVADENSLYLLEFFDKKNLQSQMKQFQNLFPFSFIERKTIPMLSIEKELHAYFSGQLKVFQTQINLHGSCFQQSVWNALMTISYGETRSYIDQARLIGKPSAYRAVANANGANRLAIIVPCHRVMSHNGQLGGYSGGVWRKEWLMRHEKENNTSR